MKLLMITRKVDPHDALAGFTFNWVKKIGENLDELYVISWQKGDRGDLPAKIKTIFLPDNKLKKVLVLEKELFKILPKVSGVFCHMNPEYTILAAFLAKIFRKKIVSWYTHKTVSWRRRLVEVFADKILTASKESFRDLWFKDKVEVTGHGIDLDVFNNIDSYHGYDGIFHIITVGRISPTKNYESMIKAMTELKTEPARLIIVGDAILPSQIQYLKSLNEMVKRLKLDFTIDSKNYSKISFAGWISNRKIPNSLKTTDLFINLSGTGSLDKAVLEAMACGCLVLTSNEAFKDILPPELMVEKSNPQKLAEKIKWLMNLPAERKAGLRQQLRDEVVKNHNLDDLVKKIVAQFYA
ncbi:MAG: glycosyltransferase family 4 protein [Patescibacteria group bacterium]